MTGFSVWLIISAGSGCRFRPSEIWRSEAIWNSVASASVPGTSNRTASAENAGSWPMMFSALSNSSGSSTAPPVMSSGLCGVPKLGSTASSAVAVAARQRRQRNTFDLQAIGGDLAGAAGDGDQPEAFAADHAGAGDDVGGEQQILDRIDPHDAELAANAVEHAVVADQ